MEHQQCCSTFEDCCHQTQEASSQFDRASSEESSPILSSQSMLPINSPLTQLPDAVFSFFKDVPTDGYPEGEALAQKVQPWRRVFQGPKPSPDGRVLIAVPKRADFGSANLGGY